MAASKSASVRKAQIPSLCHLCEDSTNIQWKCADCNLLMCEKCKTKVHSKFKSADDHDVISLKDFGSELTKPILTAIPCKVHRDKKVCLFCKTCEEVACVNCVSDYHRKHEMEDLRKVYEEKISKIEYLKSELEADLQFYTNEESKIKNQRSSDQTTKQDIIRQKEELTNIIEETASELMQKLNDNTSFMANNNEKSKEDISQEISFLEDILKENDMDTIIKMEKGMSSSLTNKPKPILREYRNGLNFCPGITDRLKIKQMFGSLEEKVVKEVTFQVLKSIQSDLGVIQTYVHVKTGMY